MPEANPKPWFPAKRYGWGWGPPNTWQGWTVSAIYMLACLGGIALFDVQHHPLHFVLYVNALSAALIAICYWKGEKPRWRWGQRGKE